MFGTTVYSTTSEDNGKDAGADNAYDSSSLSSNIIFEWERRKVKMDHDYVVTGWALSVIPEVRADVDDHMTGDHHGNLSQ